MAPVTGCHLMKLHAGHLVVRLFCCGYFVVVLYSGHIYIFLSIFILVMLLCVELKFYFT